MIAYTVHMRDNLGNTGAVEVEVRRVSEIAACQEAEFVVKTQPMQAWIETEWHAVRADRAPGAWMWATLTPPVAITVEEILKISG